MEWNDSEDEYYDEYGHLSDMTHRRLFCSCQVVIRFIRKSQKKSALSLSSGVLEAQLERNKSQSRRKVRLSSKTAVDGNSNSNSNNGGNAMRCHRKRLTFRSVMGSDRTMRFLSIGRLERKHKPEGCYVIFKTMIEDDGEGSGDDNGRRRRVVA